MHVTQLQQQMKLLLRRRIICRKMKVLHMSNIRMVLQRYFLIRTGSKTAILPVLDTMNIMAVFLLQVA
ncbi:hypothetical protein DW651_05760 [Subdoligranulum sp. AM23-21AC]|nr:hypothetical protein DW651_05760 [Subdoligranulum sp. AM23-21AC]